MYKVSNFLGVWLMCDVDIVSALICAEVNINGDDVESLHRIAGGFT